MTRENLMIRTRRRAPKRVWLTVVALLAMIALAGCDVSAERLRGTVSSHDGIRIGGAEVVLSTPDGSQVISTTTNALGEYTFRASSGIRDGAYYELTVGSEWGGAVSVQPGAALTHDVELHHNADVAMLAGTVTDAGGAPVVGALVVVYQGGTPETVALGVTGADGSFQVGVQEPGSYAWQVAHADHPFIPAADPLAAVDLSFGTTNVGKIDVTTGVVTPPAFEAIDADDSHTCAIAADDTLRCWGSDGDGRSTPPTGTYKAVAAGADHSCAITMNDTIACWGSDEYGQASPPSGTYTAVSAGRGFTCALATDDTIACWGGVGSQTRADPPSGTFSSISAGSEYSCAIGTDGTISCWGDEPDSSMAPPPGTFTSVSAGQYHTCAISMDDTVVCWGDAAYGGELDPPDGTYRSVSNGYFSSCAVATDGTVACWGDAATNPIGSYEEVSTGAAFTCASATNGAVTCWGFDDSGQSSPPSG